jgi:hypothetical protein
MTRVVAFLVALALLLAVPAAALAQDNPFAPPPIDPNAPVTQPTPTPTTTPDSGLSNDGTTTLFIIGAALLAAFVAIGLWIARDARRALPESRRDEGIVAASRNPRHTSDAKKKARQRTKAQRRARRANR